MDGFFSQNIFGMKCFVSLNGAHRGCIQLKEKRLAKTKVAVMEDGLKNAAAAVGTAIGGLAKKVGLKRVAAAVTPKHKKAVKTAVAKSATSKKKSAPAKKVVAKKAPAKHTAAKKKSPAKKK